MSLEQKFTPEENQDSGAKPKTFENFNFGGREQPVKLIERMQVVAGVRCDVYSYSDDPTKDLGVILVEPGMKTPLQKVLKGKLTVEGYLAGKGKLTIVKSDGNIKVYRVDESDVEPKYFDIEVGDQMQWEADANSALIAYEICIPSYEDGRFENLE